MLLFISYFLYFVKDVKEQHQYHTDRKEAVATCPSTRNASGIYIGKPDVFLETFLMFSVTTSSRRSDGR